LALFFYFVRDVVAVIPTSWYDCRTRTAIHWAFAVGAVVVVTSIMEFTIADSFGGRPSRRVALFFILGDRAWLEAGGVVWSVLMTTTLGAFAPVLHLTFHVICVIAGLGIRVPGVVAVLF
jgi:hypothetical protein